MCKVVLSPRGTVCDYTLKGSRFKALFHKYIGKNLIASSIVHATANNEAFDLLKRNKRQLFFIAPNIIELPPKEVFRDYKPEQVLKFIFLSRIDRKKGLELFLNVLSKVSFSFKLSIYGSGDEQYINSLKELCRNINIDTFVKWEGWISTDQKYSKLQEHDVFVLTSYNENFSNSVLEALAVGLTVFISDEVGLAEYVKNNNVGYVTSLDEKCIYEKLELLASKKEFILKNRIESPEKIYTNYNPDTITNLLIESYNKILENAI